jgi:hypothetical protein
MILPQVNGAMLHGTSIGLDNEKALDAVYYREAIPGHSNAGVLQRKTFKICAPAKPCHEERRITRCPLPP